MPRAIWYRAAFLVGYASALVSCVDAASLPDDVFLDELARRSCDYFLEQADPITGLVPDRGRADGSESVRAASLAATGFGLAALCVGGQRGWIEPTEAQARARRTLEFARDHLPQEHGYFYRYLDRKDGHRIWDSEVSSIDTALFLAGVLLCREHFPDPDLRKAADQLYDRVDWPWMLAGGRTLSIGWTPEKGFMPDRWSVYSEHMLLYLMGLGSATHPLPAESWTAWRRVPVITYGGRTFIQSPPLFTHQYAHAWIDFQGRHDGLADYGLNARLATLAQQQFCADLTNRFPAFSERVWGLSAADGPQGYCVWGGPPPTHQFSLDGTVVPCAVAGSLPFAPEACIPTLRYMREHYGDRIWKRYGFVDSFNPNNGWTASDVIGIDLGITLVMAANYQDRLVWRSLMTNAVIQRGLARAGFREGPLGSDPLCSVASAPCRKELRHAEAPVYPAVRFVGWDRMTWQKLNRCHTDIEDEGAEEAEASAGFAFAWDETNLYFAAEVEDRTPYRTRPPEQMYEDDGVELFVDPQGDDLHWGSGADRQFSFSPRGFGREWFVGGTNLTLVARDTESGYRLEATIPWTQVSFTPAPGAVLRASPAVINRFSDQGVLKLNGHWDVRVDAFALGKVRLE